MVKPGLSKMTKKEKYEEIHRSFTRMLEAELPLYVHMSNLCALLKKEFDFFWVGFYMRQGPDQLVLGPYQGEVPCFTIKMGKGVCGTAAESGVVQIVNDVTVYPNYIACHPESMSEIVIPGMVGGRCQLVMDVDHVDKDYFDDEDATELDALISVLMAKISASQ